MYIRRFFFAFLISSLAFIAQATPADTIKMAQEEVRLPVSYVKQNQRVVLQLTLSEPEEILLTGDCEPSPRLYTLMKKKAIGWEINKKSDTGIIYACGLPKMTAKEFFFSFSFTAPGRYVIIIPSAKNRYYTGEIIVE